MKDSGEHASRSVASDALAWLGNVSTSVLIVFVNKVLMDPKKGFKFQFATTLCALHFLSAAALVTATQLLGWTSKAPVPWKVTLYFSVVASISIASLNLSLLVNSVGFYQIAKLMIIPFVCLVELLWFGRRFTPPVVASILVVILGVGVGSFKPGIMSRQQAAVHQAVMSMFEGSQCQGTHPESAHAQQARQSARHSL